MYLTSLPLVSVRHHGHVSSVKLEKNYISSARSVFLVHNLCSGKIKCIELTAVGTEAKYYIEFLGLSVDVYRRVIKTASNSPFCAATADFISR